VRAAMVDDPAHYRWSSCRANGLGQTDPLLTPHALYTGLGQDEVERLTAIGPYSGQNLILPEFAGSEAGGRQSPVNSGIRQVA
jgi:hypothetical protein